MAYFEFPKTRNYDGDLGWVIKKIIELTDRYNDFFEYNSITFADPLQWDITKQYPPYQIVFDYDAGYSYISKRPVPAGVTITNPDYWCLVGPLIIDAYARSEIQAILEFITNIYETGTTASAPRAVGDYVVVNGNLYQVTAAMNIGETYGVGFNVQQTTVENMILDCETRIMAHFPVQTADIDNGAVTTAKIATGAVTTGKIADGAITTAKIADHSLTKSKFMEDKYFFIGDSYNDPAHNGGWASKIINRLGLTLGTDCWSAYFSGGGFGNGNLLVGAQTEAANISAADKLAITKILIVGGLNDWQQSAGNIKAGVENIESYLNTTFPNAEIIIVAGQWSYQNSTIRQGTLTAYNVIAASVKTAKFIDKAFLLFLDPYFLDSDATHPTNSGQENLADTLITILNGGNVWTKYYSSLNAVLYPIAGGTNNITIFGDITPAGTHVHRTDYGSIVFTAGTLTITHNPTKIGEIRASNNNFFQYRAEIVTDFFVSYYDGGVKYGIFKGRFIVEHDSIDPTIWNVYVTSDQFMINNSYNIPDVRGLYIQFDAMLDFCRT